MTTPKSKQRMPDPESLEWTRFYIETENQSETSFGAIEEAMFAIDGDEIVLADIDGRIFATHQLASAEDPAVVARRLLRSRVAKRPRPLVFPDVGVA